MSESSYEWLRARIDRMLGGLTDEQVAHVADVVGEEYSIADVTGDDANDRLGNMLDLMDTETLSRFTHVLAVLVIGDEFLYSAPVPPSPHADTDVAKRCNRVSRCGTPIYRNFTIPACREFKGLGRPGDVLACRLFVDQAVSRFPRTRPVAKREGVLGRWFVCTHPDGFRIIKVKGVGYLYIHGIGWLPSRRRVASISMRRNQMIAAYRVMEVRPGRDNEWRKDRAFVAAVSRITSESNGQGSTATPSRVV